MKQRVRWLCFAVVSLTLAACSGAGHALPQRTGQRQLGGQNDAPPRIVNVFAAARNKNLSDKDLDSYITAPLSTKDRAAAHRLMRFMPPSQRGDFLDLTDDGRVISNNAALLPYAHISLTLGSSMRMENRAPAVGSTEVRHRMDYSDSCSPTNPYIGSGPYARQVSRCGFTGGWAFIKIPCNTTALNNGDNGLTYFEITTPNNANHIEGGMFTPDGIVFDPYLRSSAILSNNGYETLTNSQARFSCDEQLAIFHGVTFTVPVQSFTEVGDASQYDPYTVWVNEQEVTVSDAAWLFGPLPPEVAGATTDAAGNPSPCRMCSISQVTTIAQSPNPGWDADGSEFGIDATGHNAIQWLQVGFGNWASDCYQGTTLCTFDVSADPFAYYGGWQAYPDQNVSGSNFSLTGYGPYETIDGIEAYGGLNSARTADVAINEPLPPPPCGLDSYGMCALNTQTVPAQCSVKVIDPKTGTTTTRYITYTHTSVYATYRSNSLLGVATKTVNEPYNGCTPITTAWSPAEPRVTYNDANLP